MDDENKLLRQRSAGHKAQKEWDSETLQAIFTEMDEEIKTGWENSKAEERDRREEIYWYKRAVERVKEKFKTRIATGKHAATRLTQIEDEKKRDASRAG